MIVTLVGTAASLAGLLYSLFGLVAFVVTVVAFVKILSQAGYSGWWILLPFGTWLFEIAAWFALSSSRPTSLNDLFNRLGILFLILFLGFLVNWGAFLVFAFSTWPVTKEAARRTAVPSVSFAAEARPTYVTPASAPLVPPASAQSPSPTTVANLTGQDAAELATTAATPTTVPQATYCVWCGKEQAADAFALHHCGSKDRPPAYCRACGATLPEGTSTCSSCGTVSEPNRRR